MNTTDKLNELFEKFKDITDGSLHNCLWQVMVNADENGYVRGQHAFTYIHVPRVKGQNVGIAHRGKTGYTPACFGITSKDLDQIDAMIEELNREVFGITDDLAFEIVAQSMARPQPAGREVN